MDLRNRVCNDVIKIGLIEGYSNVNQSAIKPFPMNRSDQPSWDLHADNVIEKYKRFVPNAEFHIVPHTIQGKQYLIDQGIKIVNISLSANYTVSTSELSNHAFLLISAGNDGANGESGITAVEKACVVGSVDSNMIPRSYSSYGFGRVKTCAVDGIPDYGTSFASPIVGGLLAQWYIWYEKIFHVYPTIEQSNDFIIKNSHDIFEDAWDLRTGYGLFRLPKYFEASKYIFTVGSNVATEIKYKENEAPVSKQINLLVTPKTENGRTVVGASDITDMCIMSRYWSGVAEYGRMK